MIRYVDFITPEEYMELRRKVGWMEFPLEEARNCVENAYLLSISGSIPRLLPQGWL